MDTDIRQRWLHRWDAQQEHYVADREERFRVVADVVSWSAVCADNSTPRVVDLGCGPGSLAARLAHTLPGAQIVGVDADPFLLALAGDSPTSPDPDSANAGSEPPRNVQLLLADLSTANWTDTVRSAGLEPPWDAAVSATALHWLHPDDLPALYKTLADHLRPGAVFVDADHRQPDLPEATELVQYVSDARAKRAGVTNHETWGSWWDAVRNDPDLGPLLDSRSEAAIAHNDDYGLKSIDAQATMLYVAGFRTVTPVWQCGNDYILVAVR